MIVYHASYTEIRKPDISFSREALDRMYNSETFKLIDGKIADLHCRSDLYLIDEFINEWKEKGDLPE